VEMLAPLRVVRKDKTETTLLVSQAGSELLVWDMQRLLSTGEKKSRSSSSSVEDAPLTNRIVDLSFHPKGHLFAAGSADCAVSLHDGSTGKRVSFARGRSVYDCSLFLARAKLVVLSWALGVSTIKEPAPADLSASSSSSTSAPIPRLVAEGGGVLIELMGAAGSTAPAAGDCAVLRCGPKGASILHVGENSGGGGNAREEPFVPPGGASPALANERVSVHVSSFFLRDGGGGQGLACFTQKGLTSVVDARDLSAALWSESPSPLQALAFAVPSRNVGAFFSREGAKDSLELRELTTGAKRGVLALPGWTKPDHLAPHALELLVDHSFDVVTVCAGGLSDDILLFRLLWKSSGVVVATRMACRPSFNTHPSAVRIKPRNGPNDPFVIAVGDNAGGVMLLNLTL
jgi:hypothetical protein